MELFRRHWNQPDNPVGSYVDTVLDLVTLFSDAMEVEEELDDNLRAAVPKGLALAAEQANAGAVLLPGLTVLVTAAQAREPFAGAASAPPKPQSDEPTATQRRSDALLAELDGLIGLDAVKGQLRPGRPQGAAGGEVSPWGRGVHR
ncbi:hypothetical protein KBY83_12245 [Cyanobium sp. WKJ7-Wakatipu]|uniref:hypothetical protein n=1 Tax=Cyanobium sp. WKJ7-Wakatipu TaxID=2823726 RepID=UPI0020CE8EEF|nr:hypothetical protein [Cyanobium sp. WKJ7-Wakatipu]MCP9784075.1 hypothetical protein [Cyanobium sp. WKJ7-Wakatipu]